MAVDLAKGQASVPVVLMSADEARTCVSRIREGMENVRALLLDLHEREGWRSLGYSNWRDCIAAEFSMSQSRAYQLLNAAQVDQILSTMVETPVPERHAREYAALIDKPAEMQSVAATVLERHGDDATSENVHDAVDEHLGRPPKVRKNKPSTRRTPDPEFNQDAPPYDDRQELPDDQISQGGESGGGICGLCEQPITGEVCPCADAPAPEIVQPTPAAPSYQPATRTVSVSKPGHMHPSASRPTPSGPPPLTIQGDAGDAMRAVADRFALDKVADGIGEAYSDTERGSLTAQLLDSLTDSEKVRIAHRANVAVKSQPPVAPTLVQVAEMGEALSVGEQLGITSRWVKTWPVTDLERLATFLPHLIERKRREAANTPLAAAV